MGIDSVTLFGIASLAAIIYMFLYVLNYMRKHIKEDIELHDKKG